MNLKKIRCYGSFLLLSTLILTVFFSVSLKTTEAQTPQELASKFAPVLHFTRDEKFFPTSADYIISSSTLKLRNSDGSSSLINSNPTVYNLGSYISTDYFLDNKLNTLDAIAADYALKTAAGLGNYAYVHIVNEGSSTVIQYWFFYAYNNGPLNDHQGDIEVIQVFLDGSGNPVTALFSQHGAGENAGWGDVEKADTHPVVYVAQGSHANYFRPFQGKIGIENDLVGSDGKTIMSSDLSLVILGELGSHPPEQDWLDFAGRWGYLGTAEEAALGRAGPFGPVQNQDGIRWAQPEAYFESTFSVGSNYFILAWLAFYFWLLFLIYVVIRAVWKLVGIIRLRRKGGLLVTKFLRGRGGLGLALGIVAILIMVVALFLPWYTITASSQAGPLANQGGVTLLNIDGISGMQVNLFLGSGGDSPSGYRSFFSLLIPFSLLLAAGIVLFALDVIGVKSGNSIGMKLILGAITSLLPFVLIFVFISQLPAFLPWASQLVPGQSVPPQLETAVRTIAGNPIIGTASAQFPVVGTTIVNWGFGVGAYLFLVAAVVKIIGGFIMRSSPKLQEKPTPPASTSTK